jgi:predicted dehydrogenase
MKVRIGIIGCGGISKPHAEGYAKIPDQAEVVGCCDVVEDSARATAAKAGGQPAIFSNWKKMLKAVELDAVDICLPHHLHCPAILDAAKAGKHIICEKPLCRTLAEAARIEKAIAAVGVIYMASHNQLFQPCLRAIREVLDSGRLGKRFWIRTQDAFHMNWSREKLGWRADLKKQGGGELIDTGYHPTYMLLYLADAPVRRITAAQSRLRLDALQADDTSCVNVQFANDVLGQIFTSWAMPIPAGSHKVHAICAEGQVWGGGSDMWVQPTGATEPEHRQFEQVNTIHAAVAHFVECVQQRKTPLATLQSAKEVLALILAAQKQGMPKA